MQHWHEVEHWLRESAREDVVTTGAIRPTLVAFGGERPLLLARWRPFGPREGRAALIELLRLAVPMGADRLAVSIGGNAWRYVGQGEGEHQRAGGPGSDQGEGEHQRAGGPGSDQGEGDGRREVLLIAVADHTTRGGRPRCVLTPFESGADGVLWGDPLVSDEVEGWLVSSLAAPYEVVTSTVSSVEQIVAVAKRCVALGHDLYIPHAGVMDEWHQSQPVRPAHPTCAAPPLTGPDSDAMLA